MKTLTALALLLLTGSFASATAQAGVTDACLSTEHWTLAKGNPNWLREYHEFTSNRSSAIYGFSQAIQLKRMSQILNNSDFEHDFSEYWVARILFELKLDPLAHQALNSVYENSENADLKKAAFSCMARIQIRSPDWKAPNMAASAPLPFTEEDSDVLFLTLLGHENGLTKKLTQGHRGFIEGYTALGKKDYTGAIIGFQSYFHYLETHVNPLLTRYLDEGHLLLGRAYYSVAKFPEAAAEFQKVKKTSNEQIEAMSNLAWSYLLHEKYDDAVGISLQLRAGALKNTFAPEPTMVSAMALNELCSYPDSIRMIQAFNKDYEPSFQWLSKNQSRDDGYVMTVKALKGQAGSPVKLTTEWIRSPEFLTRQKEINTLLDEPKLVAAIESTAQIEQKKLTDAFLARAAQFIKDYRVAQLKLKPGEDTSKEFQDRYVVLKKDLRKLGRFYKASRTWKSLARAYERKIPVLKTELVARVNKDWKSKNKKLLTLLNKVKDNTDLIEVEIYNGASQDLVWKSAHSDYAEKEKSLEETKDAPDGAHTWNWGRFLASSIENTEVWEDELGALKADVTDQCGKKEKYLKLRILKKE
jgi:hypothetical protein